MFDVREPHEHLEARIDAAVLIPLGNVPDEVERFRGDGPIYLICHVGGRSMRACEFLDGQGIDAVNVAGGMKAWLESGHEFASGPA